MQNAPAESALKLLGRIHRGMNAPIMQTAMLFRHGELLNDTPKMWDLHDSETTSDVLTDPACNGTTSVSW